MSPTRAALFMFLPFSSKYMQSSAKYFAQGTRLPMATASNISWVLRMSSSCVMLSFGLHEVRPNNIVPMAKNEMVALCIASSQPKWRLLIRRRGDGFGNEQSIAEAKTKTYHPSANLRAGYGAETLRKHGESQLHRGGAEEIKVKEKNSIHFHSDQPSCR